MSNEKTKPILLCEISGEYIQEEIKSDIDPEKKYFMVINQSLEEGLYEYPVKIFTKDADNKMHVIYEENVYFDSVIEMLQYTNNYLDWEKDTYDIFRCNERRQKRTKYGEVEVYSKPIFVFIADTTEEGIYIVFIHKTVEEEVPFLVRGIFKPNDDKKDNNHCVVAGMMVKENGYGYCSAQLMNLDDIDEQFDYTEEDIIDFL